MTKLKHQLEAFVSLYGGVQLLILREDGIPVENCGNLSLDIDQMGALSSGVWQASAQLIQLSSPLTISHQDRWFDLRADESHGLIFTSLTGLQHTYLFLAVYRNEINVGKLKWNIRKLKEELVKELNKGGCFMESNDTQNSDNGHEYLFKDISDEEMDSLFTFGTGA